METLTEDYCSFEVAKLLKEKGFDEPCRAVYNENKILRINTLCDYLNSEVSSYVCAPTHQMAMKWLREIQDIKIMIRPYVDGTYSYEILNGFYYVNFYSYEDAVEAALKYVLENLILL